MALRARPILIWIPLIAAVAAGGVWVTDFHRTIRCSIGPQLGMVECPLTDEELAALAVARRNAAERSLRTLATEGEKAQASTRTAVDALNEAEARQETVEDAVRAAEARLEEAERRLSILSTCDPAEPTGRDALAGAVKTTEADLARVRAEIAAAGRRIACLKFHAELEARSRKAPVANLHSRNARFRRVVEAETEQRMAFCREVAARSPYSLDEHEMRMQNFEAERGRVASLERDDTAILARLNEAEVALSRHDAAATDARHCAKLNATLTETEARSQVELHRTSLTGLRSISQDSASALIVASLQAKQAKAALASIGEKRVAACRNVVQAAEQLEDLHRVEAAALARRIEAEHCNG